MDSLRTNTTLEPTARSTMTCNHSQALCATPYRYYYRQHPMVETSTKWSRLGFLAASAEADRIPPPTRT
jgi:hypothetical protein